MSQSAGKSTAISMQRTTVTIIHNMKFCIKLYCFIHPLQNRAKTLNYHFQVSEGEYHFLQPIH